MNVRTPLPSLEWDFLLEAFEGKVVAIEVLEITPGIGMSKGTLIAADTSEEEVLRELDAFLAENPQGIFAYFNMTTEHPDIDIIL
jgi:hypothetical protein